LLLDDARAVVKHGDAKAFGVGLLDGDFEVREDAALLASVEAVVDGLLDRGEKRFPLVIESEQVAVLGEKLGTEISRCCSASISAVAPRRGAATARAGLRCSESRFFLGERGWRPGASVGKASASWSVGRGLGKVETSSAIRGALVYERGNPPRAYDTDAVASFHTSGTMLCSIR